MLASGTSVKVRQEAVVTCLISLCTNVVLLVPVSD